MKTILSFCIGIVLPIFLFSQNTFPKSLSRNPLSIPNLFAQNQNKFNEKLLPIYKMYAGFKDYSDNQSQSALPVKQILDSIITVPADTTFPALKSTYTFNQDGLQILNAEYEWNTSAQAWFNLTKIEWTYDSKRNILNYISYYGIGDDVNWNKEIKYENTFDSNNRLLKTEGYGWSEVNNQWEIGLKVENTYDIDGLLTSTITSIWDPNVSQWIPESKFEYEYTSGQISTAINFEWDLSNNQWKNLYKGEFTYYIFGAEREYTFYVWDGFTIWTNSSKFVTNYNVDRKLDNFTQFNWDLISVIFVNFSKTDYKYDNNLNMYQSVFSKWVKTKQDFILEAKEDCIYDIQHTNDELLLPPDMKFSSSTSRIPDNDIYFNYMLTKYSYFLHNGTTYVINSTKTFYYSPKTITKTEDNNPNLDVQVVPNPANTYFTVLADDVNSPMDFSLFDLNGIALISKKINCNGIISTESLNKGIYMFRIISSDNSIKSGKLIIH